MIPLKFIIEIYKINVIKCSCVFYFYHKNEKFHLQSKIKEICKIELTGFRTEQL